MSTEDLYLEQVESELESLRAQSPALARQVGGNHYNKLKIQPLEYALENNLGICEHAVVKYISRWRDKGGIEDLKKAKHYIDILIDRTTA